VLLLDELVLCFVLTRFQNRSSRVQSVQATFACHILQSIHYSLHDVMYTHPHKIVPMLMPYVETYRFVVVIIIGVNVVHNITYTKHRKVFLFYAARTREAKEARYRS
jgi:hypothetical protein